MQIINESNDWTHFFWVHYIPNWISPIWFYLIIWYLIIFLSVNWKTNIKIKISFTNIKWGEDLYFYVIALTLYSIIILCHYGIFGHALLVLDLLFEWFLDNLEVFTNSLVEKKEEPYLKEFLAYIKK